MRTNLRMRCPDCKHWNRVPVDKIFVEQPTSDPEVKAFIPMYAPLDVTKCKKCGKVLDRSIIKVL